MWETRVWSLDWEIPWRRKWQPTPVVSPGESQGQRSLVGYSPWGRKELDTTEQLHFLITHFSTFINEIDLKNKIIELRACKCLWNPKVAGFHTVPAVEHFLFDWSYSSYRANIRNLIFFFNLIFWDIFPEHLVCVCVYLFGHTAWHLGSWFPNQRLSLCPLQWKCRVLTTGPPGKTFNLCLMSGFV